jgi:predicted membrane protein
MSRGQSFAGWVLVILGLIFLLNNLDIEIFDFVWPGLIILLGVVLIYRAFRDKSEWHAGESANFTIGETSHSSFSGEVDGAHVSNFIGETDLNLSGGTLKAGVNKMSVSGFLGDIRLIIPQDWAVEISGSAFLGSIHLLDRSQDGIFPTCRYKSADFDTAEKKLSITCSIFVGDIKVRKA